MRHRLFVPVLALLLPWAAHAYDPADKVVATPGSMPVLLTVPHDGDEALGSAGIRTQGKRVRDLGTQELAQHTADLIEKKTGMRPYLGIAKFSRKFLDANRPEGEAQESSDAIPAYRYYHAQIARFVSEMSAKYPGRALLVDVHGQSGEPDTIFRGTRAGLTATALLKRSGIEALQGEGSLTGLLQRKGYKVFPPIGSPDLKEDRRYDGGYTVFAYGSNTPGGIDAIQLEFGKRVRERPGLAEDLAESILAFTGNYMKEPRANPR